jgi:hypothetical protein
MDQTLFGPVSPGMLRFLGIWYNEWGAFLGIVLALVSTFIIFLDAFRQNLNAVWWKIAGVVGTILVIPSVVLRVSPDLGASIGPALVPLAFVGVIGALIAFFALITYLAWGRSAEQAAQTEQIAALAAPFETPYTPEAVPAYQPQRLAPATVPSGDAGMGSPATQAMDIPPTSAIPAQAAATQILRRPPKEMGMLVVRSGPRAGQTFNLGEVTNIGRDAQRNEISLEDTSMSRENTRIKLEGGQFVIYDLASTNGTLVNGEKVLKQVLANGDAVQIGDTHFAFVEVKTKGI